MVIKASGLSARMSGEKDIFLAGVDDLVFGSSDAGPVLYSATRTGGAGIGVYRLDTGGAAQRFDQAALPGGAVAGIGSHLEMLSLNGISWVGVTGVNDTGLWGVQGAANGGIGGTAQMLGAQVLPASLIAVHSASVAGQDLIYGICRGEQTIEIWQPTADGRLGGQRTVQAGLGTDPLGPVALTGIEFGGQTYLLTAAQGEYALASYRIAADGLPRLASRVAVADGMGIADPTAIVAVELDGRGYAILAAAGSSSLSVFEIAADGRLLAVDHVIDSLNTRFAGVTQLETTRIGNSVYLAAAGSDDGISLFQLLPGGRLLHQITIEDTDATTLNNVSGLALTSVGGTLRMAASSETEQGVTLFDITGGTEGVILSGSATNGVLTGSAGDDVLTGGAGSERISGGDGDDIIRDGAGSDTLTGGEGADIFVLDADGVADQIDGFQPGIDRIDLSGWTFLRGLSQLTIRSTWNGAEIGFGAEILRIGTVGNQSMTEESVRGMTLLDLDRLLPSWFVEEQTAIQAGTLTGTAGNDTLTGDTGNEQLFGQGGDDTLFGSAGDDELDGGAGADYLNGGPGSDIYRVDNPGDRVVESRRWEGVDHVFSSVDFWMGRAHVENLTLQGNADIRGIGNGLQNVITGNSGSNILDGGRNNDTLIGGDGNDTYYLRAPGDTAVEAVDGGIDAIRAYRSVLMPDNIERLYIQTTVALNGIGNDMDNLIVGNMADNVLIGRGGNDVLRGQGGADTFVFDRAPAADNIDRILDFTPAEDRLWLKGSLFRLAPGDLHPGVFVQGTRATDPNDRILYDKSQGQLWLDADGSGPIAPVLAATFDGMPDLTHTDFLIF